MLVGQFVVGVILVLAGLMNIYRGYFGEYRELGSKLKKDDSAPGKKPYWTDKIRRARIVGIVFCLIGLMMMLFSFIR